MSHYHFAVVAELETSVDGNEHDKEYGMPKRRDGPRRSSRLGNRSGSGHGDPQLSAPRECIRRI